MKAVTAGLYLAGNSGSSLFIDEVCGDLAMFSEIMRTKKCYFKGF